MKKLTDSEIKEMEMWAKNKRKYGFATADERFVTEQIEAFQLTNWKGIRIDAIKTGNDVEAINKKFEELKRYVSL